MLKPLLSGAFIRLGFALITSIFLSVSAVMANSPVVFVASFASGDKGAIHAYQLDVSTGALKPLHRTTGVENPFFIALSRDGRFSTQSTPGNSAARSRRKSPPSRLMAAPAG